MDRERDDGWQPYDQGGPGADPHGGAGAPYTHDPYEEPHAAPYPGQEASYPHGAPQHPAEGRTNVFAVVSLVTSILGLVGGLPFIGSVAGIVFAVLARKEIAADPSQQGKGLADWGLILGVVGLVFWSFMAVVMMFMAALFDMFWWDMWWY